MVRIRKKTLLTAKHLTTHQLTKIHSKDIKLDLTNLFGTDTNRGSDAFLLGFYSKLGIEYALKKYGVFNLFEKMGFSDPKVEIHTQDPYQQRFEIFSQSNGKKYKLVELVLKRHHHTISADFPSSVNGRSYEFIFVEWIHLQNPLKKFNEDKPRLPGQDHPGLGGGRLAIELLTISCKRLRLAGLLAVPEFYHNAEMYSKAFFFVNPASEGKRKAISRDLLKDFKLSEVSWAIDLNCVYENNKPFKWFTSEVILPLDRDLKEYLHSPQYRNAVKITSEKYCYKLDVNCWNDKKTGIKNYQL